MPLKATLDDVARTAGVHRSTVSLSLRDHPRIPLHTRERVKAVARQLGYRIDPLVSALMQIRRSPRLRPGIALGFLGHQRSPGSRDVDPVDYFVGAAAHARDAGFRLQRFYWETPRPGSLSLSEQLLRNGIKGLLIESLPAHVAGQSFDWSRFACVALEPPASPLLHRVTENVFDAVAEALQRCAARGYEKVGLVPAAPTAPAWRADRMLGAYTMEQLRLRRDATLPVCPGQPVTFSVFRRWFFEHEPAAVLTDEPLLVRGWLHRLGRRVPTDVGLVAVQIGGDAICSGFRCDPAITGALAVDTLVDLIRRHEMGVPAVSHEILIGASWHEGGTLPPRTRAAAPAIAPDGAVP